MSAGLKRARRDAFARAELREPSHAGSAYPEERRGPRPDAGAATWRRTPRPDRRIGRRWGSLRPTSAPREASAPTRRPTPRCHRPPGSGTVVILGTSHYGEPERFGLTRKPFVTPLGRTGVDLDVVEGLFRAAPGAVTMEDYCHAVEHAIEFQVLFLQHVWGAGVRVVPILCGPFARSTLDGRPPGGRRAGRGVPGRTRGSGRAGGDRGSTGCWASTWPTSGGATVTPFGPAPGRPALDSVERRDRAADRPRARGGRGRVLGPRAGGWATSCAGAAPRPSTRSWPRSGPAAGRLLRLRAVEHRPRERRELRRARVLAQGADSGLCYGALGHRQAAPAGGLR